MVSGWPRVGVVGGSLGGLTAALVLRDLGCDVEVFERSIAELESRGAGIVVLDETIRYFRRKIELTGVKLRLGVRVTREQLLAEGYDDEVLADVFHRNSQRFFAEMEIA